MGACKHLSLPDKRQRIKGFPISPRPRRFAVGPDIKRSVAERAAGKGCGIFTESKQEHLHAERSLGKMTAVKLPLWLSTHLINWKREPWIVPV